MSLLAEHLARHAPPGQVVRFLIVGAWNTLFAYGLFALLTYLLTPVLPNAYAAAMTASASGTVICISMSFVCHKLFVFRTKGNFLEEYLRSFVVYGGTSLAGLVLLPVVMAALNWLISARTAVPYLAGAILTAGTVVVSFVGHRRFTFAGAATAEENEERTTGNQE